jgi:hypothetical protein
VGGSLAERARGRQAHGTVTTEPVRKRSFRGQAPSSSRTAPSKRCDGRTTRRSWARADRREG